MFSTRRCRRRCLSRSLLLAAGLTLVAVGGLGPRADVAAKELSHASLPRPAVHAASAASLRGGDIVAYIASGDLYTKVLPDGPVRRLTHDGHSGSPVWSPNGKWIAVRQHPLADGSKDCLRVVSRDGRVTRKFSAAEDDEWCFSPHADKFAKIDEKEGIRITDLATGRSRRIGHTASGGGIFSLAWSPDGRWFAFTQAKLRPSRDGDVVTTTLWTLRSDGKRMRRLYVAGWCLSPDAPQWSADGRFVLFHALIGYHSGSVNADGTPLYVCRRDSGKIVRRFDANHGDDILRETAFLSFRQQDSELAITVGGSRFCNQNKRIYLADPTYRYARPITPSNLAATYPLWSPDGKRIAFWATPVFKETPPGSPRETEDAHERRWDASFRDMRIYLTDAQGRHLRRLETGPDCTGPVWLSDSRHLLFERTTENGPNSLWAIDADTGEDLRCVVPTVGARNEDDSWSEGEPDGFAVWSPTRTGK